MSQVLWAFHRIVLRNILQDLCKQKRSGAMLESYSCYFALEILNCGKPDSTVDRTL